LSVIGVVEMSGSYTFDKVHLPLRRTVPWASCSSWRRSGNPSQALQKVRPTRLFEGGGRIPVKSGDHDGIIIYLLKSDEKWWVVNGERRRRRRDDDTNRLHNATTTVPRRPADCLRRAELYARARTVCTFRDRSRAHARTLHSHRNYTGLSGLRATTTTPWYHNTIVVNSNIVVTM